MVRRRLQHERISSTRVQSARPQWEWEGIDQIRFCAEGAGIDLRNSDDPKILIEQIRRHLMT